MLMLFFSVFVAEVRKVEECSQQLTDAIETQARPTTAVLHVLCAFELLSTLEIRSLFPCFSALWARVPSVDVLMCG